MYDAPDYKSNLVYTCLGSVLVCDHVTTRTAASCSSAHRELDDRGLASWKDIANARGRRSLAQLEGAARTSAHHWNALCGSLRVNQAPDGVLAQMAREGGIMSALSNGCMRQVTQLVGGFMTANHMDESAINKHFGDFPNFTLLQKLVRYGAPITVAGNEAFKVNECVARGNYPMETKHIEVFQGKVVEDLCLGRALLLPKQIAIDVLGDRLHVNPVFIVEEGADKFRVIHDLSAAGHNSFSVNSATDFDSVPVVECGKVFSQVIYRIWQLRQNYPQERIVISKMDVKSAFRQIPVDLSGPLFGYCYEEMVVVDLRLQFGWRCSPGWWGVAGNAIEWAVQRFPPVGRPATLEPAVEECRQVKVCPPQQGTIIVSVSNDEQARRTHSWG